MGVHVWECVCESACVGVRVWECVCGSACVGVHVCMEKWSAVSPTHLAWCLKEAGELLRTRSAHIHSGSHLRQVRALPQRAQVEPSDVSAANEREAHGSHCVH